MSGVGERLARLGDRIAAAAARAGRRPEHVTLVGVSKGIPDPRVAESVRAGLTHLGESYAQEAAARRSGLEAGWAAEGVAPPRWHFIGRLQRNKARVVVGLFDVVHTLDRAALGDALERHAAGAERTLEVLIQVDTSGEKQKGGVAPEAAAELLAASRAWPHLRPVGLMTIPAAAEDPEDVRPAFAALRRLRDRLAADHPALRELSMGMSADFEVAIEEGATIIRVGTALFGPRE